jgi:hypothetical protein
MHPIPHRAPGLNTMKTSLKAASICCLAIWAAVWCLFMLIRFSGFDIRVIPGIGPIMLVALVVSVLAPVVAIGIAAVTLVRSPRSALSWLILGGAVAAFVVVGVIFAATRWL